jgi:hypothetical protein
MILAGRLSGTLDGRPVVIEAGESGVTLRVSALRSVWTLRKIGRSSVPLLRLLKFCEIPTTLCVADRLSVSLLPRPGILVRLLAPMLAEA